MEWEEIYSAEMPRVFNYFRYLLGNDQMAEDLTADTFRKAWQHRQRYNRDRAKFSTWLFTIARRTAVDYFRCQRAEDPLEAAATLAGAGSPESKIQFLDEISRLATILNRFPNRERQLIALKFGAGLTHREIARQMHLTETNISTLLQRVVRKLHDEWEDEP